MRAQANISSAIESGARNGHRRGRRQMQLFQRPQVAASSTSRRPPLCCESARKASSPGSIERTCSRACIATRLEARKLMALRAGVLRRAVSLSARPLSHRPSAAATLGRSSKASALATMPSPPNLSGGASHLACQVGVSWAREVQPNTALNRTRCGRRQKARHFILGLLPPTATARLA